MTVVNVSSEKIGILITTWQLLKLAFPMFLSSASWVSCSDRFKIKLKSELTRTFKVVLSIYCHCRWA